MCSVQVRHSRLSFSRDHHQLTSFIVSGYGYQVRFVEDLENIDQDMAASLDWAVKEIRHIQQKARTGNPIVKPRWPVLILRTPKVRLLLGFILF